MIPKTLAIRAIDWHKLAKLLLKNKDLLLETSIKGSLDTKPIWSKSKRKIMKTRANKPKIKSKVIKLRGKIVLIKKLGKEMSLLQVLKKEILGQGKKRILTNQFLQLKNLSKRTHHRRHPQNQSQTPLLCQNPKNPRLPNLFENPQCPRPPLLPKRKNTPKFMRVLIKLLWNSFKDKLFSVLTSPSMTLLN